MRDKINKAYLFLFLASLFTLLSFSINVGNTQIPFGKYLCILFIILAAAFLLGTYRKQSYIALILVVAGLFISFIPLFFLDVSELFIQTNSINTDELATAFKELQTFFNEKTINIGIGTIISTIGSLLILFSIYYLSTLEIKAEGYNELRQKDKKQIIIIITTNLISVLCLFALLLFLKDLFSKFEFIYEGNKIVDYTITDGTTSALAGIIITGLILLVVGIINFVVSIMFVITIYNIYKAVKDKHITPPVDDYTNNNDNDYFNDSNNNNNYYE